MAVTISKEPWDVDQRLRALGLDTQLLSEIVSAMVQAKAGCTPNDPPAAPCWLAWQMGTRRARELLRPLGWDKDDADTWSVIVNHALSLKVVVVNSDAGTGLTTKNPINLAKKGPKSSRSAYDNRQQVFDIAGFVEDLQRRRVSEQAKKYATWCLCAYIEGDVVRAELSQATVYTMGFVSAWQERILFLPDGSLLTGSAMPPVVNPLSDEEMTPDFPIEIRRK